MDPENMCIATLLRRRPDAEEVLAWHGVDPALLYPTETVGSVLQIRRLDGERLELDLLALGVYAEFDPESPLDDDDVTEARPPATTADEALDLSMDDDRDPDVEPPGGWWEDFAERDLKVHGRRFHP